MRRAFDVVIVGSGPVGSAVARTVSDHAPELRVLIVEAGPVISRPPGRHVKTLGDAREVAIAQAAAQAGRLNGSPTEGRVIARPGTYLLGDGAIETPDNGLPAAAMSTNVGGMGAHWTCACPAPGDGERVPWIPRAEFDAVFAEAHRMLRVTQDAFAGWPLGEELRAVLARSFDARREPERRVQAMPLAITVDGGERYWTGTDVILGDILTRSVELRDRTTAVAIEHSDGDVSAVTLRDSTGATETVSAESVFVAADSFRTPQLLHASGIEPDALGRYLNDHLQVMALAQLDDDLIADAGDGPSNASRTTGALDLFSGVDWIPYDRETFPFHGQIMQMDTFPIPVEAVPEPRAGSVVGIGLFGAKDIRREDRVHFDDDKTDESGLPAIVIDYALTERDRETQLAMKRAAERIAMAVGGLVPGQDPRALPNGSSLHYMGTVRMGPADDGTSVCDGYGRVWGTRGLFVGGNGVIPTPTACNPTATSVALAIRSAHALIEESRNRAASGTRPPTSTLDNEEHRQ